MEHNDKLRMVEAMNFYGGSFVQALAECFVVADNRNVERLCDAFPEIVTQYTHLVRLDTLPMARDTDATLKELDNMRDNLSDDEIGELLDERDE